VARRIQETARIASPSIGTLYPALLGSSRRVHQAQWRQSNNRRAKFYALTAAGRKQLAREAREWHRTADLIAAFLAPRPEQS
jgi:DNA-binding PadR family transcriptional regulator